MRMCVCVRVEDPFTYKGVRSSANFRLLVSCDGVRLKSFYFSEHEWIRKVKVLFPPERLSIGFKYVRGVVLDDRTPSSVRACVGKGAIRVCCRFLRWVQSMIGSWNFLSITKENFFFILALYVCVNKK